MGLGGLCAGAGIGGLTWGFGGLVGVGGGVYGDRCVCGRVGGSGVGWLGWVGRVSGGLVPGWVSGRGGVPGYRWLWISGGTWVFGGLGAGRVFRGRLCEARLH